MKAIVINQYGSREQLTEREVSIPSIGDNQVLLNVHATSINPIDWKVREGYLQDMLPFSFPIILGWDAAGVIERVGKNVTNFSVGDRVFTRPATTSQGTYAEYTAVDEHLLAKMPDSMSFEEGASIPLAAMTAWQCLVDVGKIDSGQKVLIHAGAGGVGHFAIQIAKNFHAYVATTASEKNREFVQSLGADKVIDYRKEDFSEQLKDYDIVLDAIGGDVQTKSYHVLQEKGKLISISQPPVKEEAEKYNVEAHFVWLEPRGTLLQKLGGMYETGTLKPFIGETFPLSEQGVKEAHASSESHHVKGKIVITKQK